MIQKRRKKLYTNDSKDYYTYNTQYNAYVKEKSGGIAFAIALAGIGTILSVVLPIAIRDGF